MLTSYLYGYLNRVRSSRRLEAEAMRNLELIWLLRRLRPDYKTIADLRRDNRGAFKENCHANVARYALWAVTAANWSGLMPGHSARA